MKEKKVRRVIFAGSICAGGLVLIVVGIRVEPWALGLPFIFLGSILAAIGYAAVLEETGRLDK